MGFQGSQDTQDSPVIQGSVVTRASPAFLDTLDFQVRALQDIQVLAERRGLAGSLA